MGVNDDSARSIGFRGNTNGDLSLSLCSIDSHLLPPNAPPCHMCFAPLALYSPSTCHHIHAIAGRNLAINSLRLVSAYISLLALGHKHHFSSTPPSPHHRMNYSLHWPNSHSIHHCILSLTKFI